MWDVKTNVANFSNQGFKVTLLLTLMALEIWHFVCIMSVGKMKISEELFEPEQYEVTVPKK